VECDSLKARVLNIHNRRQDINIQNRRQDINIQNRHQDINIQNRRQDINKYACVTGFQTNVMFTFDWYVKQMECDSLEARVLNIQNRRQDINIQNSRQDINIQNRRQDINIQNFRQDINKYACVTHR
jgi:hypothetical protein